MNPAKEPQAFSGCIQMLYQAAQYRSIHGAFSFKVGSEITVIISVSGEICPLLVMTYGVEERHRILTFHIQKLSITVT